jgi:hypothetical protein
MKNLIVRILVTALAMQTLFFASPLNVHAQEETCPPPTPVDIDIKPSDALNKINLSAKGLLPVAVLTTPDFDASNFRPEMAHLSDAAIALSCVGAEAVRWNYSDVNRDGQLDLVFLFRTQDLNLTASSTAATLMAHGTYNSTVTHIEGTDSVLTKP